uniref:Lens epithelial protein n=1 Tax=Terrapene triunguis TaxID=2587831 RepID=A0A674JMV3_9SAUR
MQPFELQRIQQLPASAQGAGLGHGPVGLNLSYWLLDVLRECAYVLLCCWCIKELLD